MKSIGRLVCLLALGPGVAEALAQGESESSGSPPTEAVAATDSRISIDLSLKYESSYFFRGIAQRTRCFNLQPAATVKYAAFEHEGLALSLLGGSWNNFTDDRAPGATSAFSETWYEADLFAGVSLAYERLSFDAVYTWYLSPASDFTEYDDLTMTLRFSDAGLWDDGGSFGLNPYVSLAVETRNSALGPNSGVWLGLGIAPGLSLGDTALGGASLSFPIGVGLSLDDYYQRADGSSDTFGFFEAGAVLSFALHDRLGPAAPTVDLGVRYLHLGGVTTEVNDGRRNDVVFSVGLRWSF